MLNLPLLTLNKNKLAAAAASVTWTLSDYVIPAGTRHLAVIWNGAKTATADMGLLRFNGDTAGNYNDQILTGAGAVASAARANAATSIQLGQAPTGANLFGGGMILFPHYANTANHKAVLAMGGEVENRIDAITGRWANTAAIASITILTSSSTFVANSIFLLCAVDERYLVEESSLSADGTVTFSAIPQTPEDLVVVGYARTDRANADDGLKIHVNGDVTDTNYPRQYLYGLGATTVAGLASDAQIGGVAGDAAAANVFSPFVISISQHANGVKQPHYLAISGSYNNSTNSIVMIASARRANIAAITSVSPKPTTGTNFKSGSLFSLYHVPKRLVDYTKLTADAATATHTAPTGYEAIFPSVFARSDVVAATDSLVRSFNNDVTDANYDTQILTGDGSTVAAATSAASRIAAVIPAASAGANIFGGGVAMIPAYTETDRHKHALSIDGAADDIVALRSMRWENTAAITEIDETDGGNFEGN